MRQHHEDEQNVEEDGRYGEEVDGNEVFAMGPMFCRACETGNMGYVSRNVRHVCDGGFLRRGMYFDTVAWETRMPSFSNSPWMRGAPHMLAVAMRLISARTSGSILGRPPLGRLRQVQYLRNPARCHSMTVAGFTMISESCHLPQNRDSNAHSPRSALVTVTTLPKPAERTSLVLHSELADPVADAKGSHYN